MLVELTEDNIDGYVKVESCKIAQGTGTFSVKASVEEKPASDDDNFYLLKMNMSDSWMPGQSRSRPCRRTRNFP